MNLSVHPYRLPLTEPLVLAGTPHAERTGALLRLEDDYGHVGWGDAAPLPGFSRETADEAAAQLRDLAAWAEHHDFARWDDPALDALDLLPSVRYALDLALLDLHAQREGCSLARALSPSSSGQISINALLASPHDALDEAGRLVAAGYETLKVKAGRRDVAGDVALLRSLREHLPSVTLRADANRAWSFDEARRFAGGVRGLDLAFVEEPLADASRLADLHRETGVPIALDESLVDVEAGGERGAVPPWTAAVVLKPTFLGGLARSMRFVDAARKTGAAVVVSSAFESGVGVRGLVALAAATDAAPSGLDPYRRLAADVLHPRLPLDQPTVEVAGLLGPPYSVGLPPPA
jgi:O-succinylbenzoate synthase